MKNITFTICAKNYIGLAQVLEKSVKRYNPDIDFFIVVADELDTELRNTLAANVIAARDIVGFSREKWDDMAFKYDLTEFCTAIKPSCFKYFLDSSQANTCIYLDPDILVFGGFEPILTQLEDYSIIVTPHITTIEEDYTGSLPESGLFYTGMFNLGFLAVKSDLHAKKMLNWWEKRLEDRCFQSRMENYFTDQKWMDFLPSFFSRELLISSHLGMNMAPWNFYEREIFMKDEAVFVKNRLSGDISETAVPLIFVHFSGFNYNSLLGDRVEQSNITGLKIYPDIHDLMQCYITSLKDSSFASFRQLPYSYNYFSNGKMVTKTYRRLYRRLVEDGGILAQPFDAKGDYYRSLKDGGVLNNNMASADKTSVANLKGVNSKLTLLNKFFYYSFKLLGPERFFMLIRLMRIYSKVENHVYLINKEYLKRANIRD